MFLRNAWYCAGFSGELGQTPIGRVFLNEPVVMFRTMNGTPVALEDRCCHRRAPLSKGKVEGDRLRCGYHGFLYDASGAVVWVPGQDKIPPDARVGCKPVRETNGFAWIWMGDPARIDEMKTPDFHWNDAPGWASFGELLPVRADYLTLVDNLLDLSHLAFLHEKTIGASDDTNPELSWERGDDFVRGLRIGRNVSPSASRAALGEDLKTDTYKTMTYTAPAHISIEMTVTEAGKRPGDKANRIDYQSVILNTMTPETDRSCHYFWTFCRNYRLNDPQFAEMMFQNVRTAHNEDKAMLEETQRIVDLDPEAPQIDVFGDHGGLQARRVFARMLGLEQGGEAAAN